MSKRNRRTPEQIIAATAEKLNAMKQKQDIKAAKSHPAAVIILDALAAVEKEEREAKKGLGSGPQSFDNRMRAHNFWIDEIAALEDVAHATVDNAAANKDWLKSQLAAVIETIIEGEEPDLDHIKTTIEANMEIGSVELEAANYKLQTERAARLDFKAGISTA